MKYLHAEKNDEKIRQTFGGTENNAYLCPRKHIINVICQNEPIHVHVEGNDGYAKYELAGEEFVLKETQGIKAKDRKKIELTIEENKDIIISRWKEYFKI